MCLFCAAVGERVRVSATRCNIRIPSNSKCWFTLAHPVGHHTMDLSKPYDRAVAFALLDIAANHRYFASRRN